MKPNKGKLEGPPCDEEEPKAKMSEGTPNSRHSTGKKIALLQTLILLSLALVQQKMYASATAVDQPKHTVIDENRQKVTENMDLTVIEQEQDEDDDSEALQRYNHPLIHTSSKASTSPQEHSRSKNNNDSNAIIVATVDGGLAGLSRETGELLWTRSGNEHKQVESLETPQWKKQRKESQAPLLEPLVSTTTTVKSSSSDWRTAAVPSIDGNVYLTAAGRDSSSSSSQAASDVTVTTTLRELTSRAPFIDNRGRIYTGTQSSTAVAVDGDTGEILKSVSTEGQSQVEQDPSWQDRNVVWLGRIDHSVSVHEPRSGNLDVQFSSAEIISVNDMVLGSGQHQPWEPEKGSHPLLVQGSLSTFGQKQFQAPTQGQSQLVATPNGNLAYRNPQTGRIEWIADEHFDTPVVFAFDSASGDSLGVDIVSDAAMPNGSTDYLFSELERQLELMSDAEGLDDDEQTIVGSLSSGELFALPLGKRTASSNIKQHHSALASSTTALAQPKHQHISKVPQFAGRQHSNFYHDAKHSGSAAKKTCSSSSPNYPSCLISNSDRHDPFSRGPGGSFLSEPAPHFEQDGAIVHHHPFGYIPPEQFHLLKQGQERRKMLKILGSWLPPTLALLFVVSFELGRRKRLQEGKIVDVESDKIISFDGKANTTNVGVIQVQEDTILGYGGHGTVVFKGMLEGRQVAVKRMLKAYHASADREISLLIESDGHPNVVRYFLKEVRGDFVYLALELCDLSLHDLIGTLRSNCDQVMEKENRAPTDVCVSTKAVLLQIASGVRHLHHLRIVHRDLKPANILLADSRNDKKRRKAAESEGESVFDIFVHGSYVAKISDMGLGKQLVGQSSYGASTLDTSFRGQSNGGQSSMVGAGPGSVGWQAPEVMALRQHSDSSVRSDGSSAVNESFPEVSPIDVSSSSRTSRSVDIFSLGCIFYSTLLPGSHPFGEWYEREANIMHNRPSIEALKEFSLDAYDLVYAMIQRNPSARPTAKQVCEHPFFWSAGRRLAFLCDFSDRLETEGMAADEDPSSSYVQKLLAVERNAAQVVGTSWAGKLDGELVNNVQRFRTYDPASVRDLLRLIRNKHHHFDELPEGLKMSMGSNTDGLMNYFEGKFPRLVVHCYTVCRELLSSDDPLSAKYSITPIKKLGNKQLESKVSVIKEEVSFVEPSENKVEQCIPDDALGAAAADMDEKASSLGSWHPIENSSLDPAVDDDTPVVVPSELLPEIPASCDDIKSEIPSPIPAPCDGARDSFVGGQNISTSDEGGIVVWEGSTAARTFNNRGWSRSDDEWVRRADANLRKRDSNLVRCADDPKFRTRLCNHWDVSLGTFCPMRKKNKCVFAHGPVELRVKEGKRNRWGKLVDKNGDNKNPKHSGGEDTYGAARSIETERKQEGKWNTDKNPQKGKKAASAKKRTGVRVL